jgi:hypothetical protein
VAAASVSVGRDPGGHTFQVSEAGAATGKGGHRVFRIEPSATSSSNAVQNSDRGRETLNQINWQQTTTRGLRAAHSLGAGVVDVG